MSGTNVPVYFAFESPCHLLDAGLAGFIIPFTPFSFVLVNCLETEGINRFFPYFGCIIASCFCLDELQSWTISLQRTLDPTKE
jgi:hypothetical protein